MPLKLVTNKELSGNTATLTTSTAHGLSAGYYITVNGVDATFDGSYTVTATSASNTFSYSKTASNVSSTASSGSVLYANIDDTGRPGYMYDENTDTWFAIAGKIDTGRNYTFTGSHTYQGPVEFEELPIVSGSGGLVTTTGTQTLTNKTLTSPTISNPTFTGQMTGVELAFSQSIVFEGTTDNTNELTLSAGDPTSDRTVTLPNATTTLVGTDTTDTLTNKTLTAAVVDASSLVVTGITDVAEITEKIADLTLVSNSASPSFLDGTVFFISASPSANFTLDIQNVPTTNGKVTTFSFMTTQGATGYYPNVLRIGGVSQTIRWSGGSAPSPTSTANDIDIFNFTLIRRSSSWVVLGNANLDF